MSDLLYYSALYERGDAVRFSVLNEYKTEVIGICEFSQIIRHDLQACHLGYSIAEKYEGQGFMSEALEVALKYMFKTFKMHRIMANYMPRNKRSERVLQRLGFEKEGLAKSYLKIAGCWEDHILTAKVNDE